MPTQEKAARIDPSAYYDVADSIFRKGNDFTGLTLAAAMGWQQFKLWTKVFKTGLTAHEALLLADALDQWVVKLLGMTRHLRQLAIQLQGGTLPKQMNRLEARRQALPRRYAATTELPVSQEQGEGHKPSASHGTDEAGTSSADETANGRVAHPSQERGASSHLQLAVSNLPELPEGAELNGHHSDD